MVEAGGASRVAAKPLSPRNGRAWGVAQAQKDTAKKTSGLAEVKRINICITLPSFLQSIYNSGGIAPRGA
jgi:hypothetical protein